MANEKRVRADFVFGTTDTALDTGSTTTTLLSDHFDRADATALGSPQIGPDPVYYTGGSAVTANWGIAGNAAKPVNNTSNDQIVYWNLGTAEYIMTVTLTQVATGASGQPAISSFVVRADTTGSQYLVQASGTGNWELYWREGATSYALIQSSTTAVAAGQVLETTVTSSGVSVKVNGVSTLSDTNTRLNTLTYVGLRAYDGDVKWDSLKVATAPSGTATSTLSSPALSRLPVIDDTNHAALALTDAATGVYEIVHAISHASGATTATVQRAREGSTARSWPSGTTWQHGPTARDVPAAITKEWVSAGADGHFPALTKPTFGEWVTTSRLTFAEVQPGDSIAVRYFHLLRGPGNPFFPELAVINASTGAIIRRSTTGAYGTGNVQGEANPILLHHVFGIRASDIIDGGVTVNFVYTGGLHDFYDNSNYRPILTATWFRGN